MHAEATDRITFIAVKLRCSFQHNLSFDLALEAATVETARSRGYYVGVAVTVAGSFSCCCGMTAAAHIFPMADSGKPSARQIYGFAS
jgi:hypothetical protein